MIAKILKLVFVVYLNTCVGIIGGVILFTGLFEKKDGVLVFLGLLFWGMLLFTVPLSVEAVNGKRR